MSGVFGLTGSNSTNPREEQMQKSWNSPIYGFFELDPIFSISEGRESIEFVCNAPDCLAPHGRRIRRYLDTKDKGSTGNMKRHAVKCWGQTVVDKSAGSNARSVREGIAKTKVLKNGTIPMAFAARGSGVVSYSNTPLTKTQIQCVIQACNQMVIC